MGRSRFGDLFRGHYRRRAIGLLVAGTLRPIAVVATLTWAYYHAWNTVGLSPAVASGVFIVGGALGLVGFPIGARLANLWAAAENCYQKAFDQDRVEQCRRQVARHRREQVAPPPESAAALPTLVELGSLTCVPCKMMEEVLDELRSRDPENDRHESK